MKNTMKTIIRSTRLVMLVFLPALLSAVQAQAVTYKAQSYQVQNTKYPVYSSSSIGEATAPSATFQSTSVYAAPEWAEEPTLNSDGTINAEVYGVGAKNAFGLRKSNTPPPPGQQDPKNQLPLGDAVIPLMLLAIGWGIYKRIYKRKRTQLTCP